ncbi:MAG: winged helix-turn-helix domain-containing protein [Vicinamibacteria bacterium]|nr:winged helix-turn-helix domain-containing protein [Vicinamibacteria bacterium]
MPRRCYRFSGFMLDMDRGRLVRGGASVPLEGVPLAVLHALVSRPGRVLSKQELLNRVWGTAAVEESALTTAIHKARRALGGERGLIRTVHGQGYELAAKVLAPVTAGDPLAEKLRALHWIAYEPVGYDPVIGRYPSLSSIREDMRVLRRGGLNGLITFRAEGTLAEIPMLAREAGFEGVIMGLRTDQERLVSLAETSAANVDSFCLGHNEPPSAAVVDIMGAVRDATNKPVTSTWYLDGSNDPAYEAITSACDWLFPDVGAPWRERHHGVDRQIEDLEAKIHRAAALARAHDTVVMLKMVSFPSGGIAGYSAAEQLGFFSRLLGYYRSPGYPYRASVFLSFFSAFDIEWKTRQAGYSPCERHIGFYGLDRRPKEAAASFSGTLVYSRRDH